MSTCLTVADFERLDGGQFDDAAARRVRDHLDSCKTCREAYEHFQDDQNFLARAKSLLSDRTRTVATDSDRDTSSPHQQDQHFPRIDGYRILDVLGRGGMGIVYRAVQAKLKRTVALKVLPAVIGSASPSAVSRFRREAHSAARLHHTHIIPIYDFGESHGGYYYAMELITGQPLNLLIHRFVKQNAASASPARLAELLRHTTMETTDEASLDVRGAQASVDSFAEVPSPGKTRWYYQQVARWMADAADALQYAHGQGIIHRDIKPANIILSIDGRVMIGDFGLAKDIDEESLTMTGSLLGTVRYLSPEQAMAKRVPVDHRTDIYSLGATTYELLTFQPAFPGDDDKQILSAIITRDPTPLRKIVHSLPQELETICLKSLEKSPDARYDTARAMAEDLRRYLNDLPIVAKPPGPLKRALKFVRRHKTLTVSVAAVLLLTAASVFYATERQLRLAQEINNLIDEGQRLKNAEAWEAAEAKYEEVLRRDSFEIRALGNLAILYKDWSNSLPNPDYALLEKGNKACDSALEISPENPGLWNVKGVLFKKYGLYDESLEALRRADELYPNSYYFLANLGMVRALKGDLKEAEAYLLKAAELAGGDEKPPPDPYRNLAALELHLGRPSAIRSIEAARALSTSDVATLLVFARVRLKLEGYRDFRDALKKATTADEQARKLKPKTKCILALAELRNRHFNEAIENAHAAIEGGDMETMNDLIIAIAEANMAHREAARDYLQKAEEAWPAQLRDAGAYTVTGDKGVLWFESASELIELRKEARELIAATPDPP